MCISLVYMHTFQAVGGNGAEQTVVSGSMEVLRPCWAVATSGVPVREQLFNVSICHYTHFNLFQHGDFSRAFSRASDITSLEVATPILIPRSDGHKHRKGSHGDVIFLTNRGEVFCLVHGSSILKNNNNNKENASQNAFFPSSFLYWLQYFILVIW